MNRRSFLSRCAAALGLAVTAPAVLAEQAPRPRRLMPGIASVAPNCRCELLELSTVPIPANPASIGWGSDPADVLADISATYNLDDLERLPRPLMNHRPSAVLTTEEIAALRGATSRPSRLVSFYGGKA